MRARLRRIFPILLALLTAEAAAQSTIDPAAANAWGGNAGWFNWRPSATDGVVTGEYVCSGYVWGTNVGWINLGSGTPADGIRYTNTDGADSGVNVLADGALRGLAWGANIGWVNFEPVGNPRIDFATGILTGYAWGANVGWITLDDGGSHFVATTEITAGADGDADGITDAWELDHAPDLLTLTLGGDADGDGISDAAEYSADTDPLSVEDRLRITDFAVSTDTTLVSLTWTSRVSRRYHIEWKGDLGDPTWEDSALGSLGADSDDTTTRDLAEAGAAQRFYRIRAKRPLAP